MREGRRGGRPESPGTLSLLLFLISSHQIQTLSASEIIRYDGDVNIGVLVDLHDSQDGRCTRLNMETVQLVLAAKWAVDVINNQSLPHELSIGLQIHDTCSNSGQAQKQLFEIIRTVQSNASSQPRLIGLVAMGGPETLLSSSTALSAFQVPVINVKPDFYSDLGLGGTSNVLTTAPDLGAQARSLVHIGSELGASKVALITSSHNSVASFLTEATSLGLRVQEMLEVTPGQSNLGPAVETFLRSLARPRPVVALVLQAEDVEAVAEHLQNIQLASSPVWLVGSLGLELRTVRSWRRVFTGGIFVEPHMPQLREFKHFFLRSIQSPDILTETVEEYLAEVTGCTTLGGGLRQNANGKGVSCSNISLEEMELRFQQDPQVSFVVKAVSALTAAFRLVQLSSCDQRLDVPCLRRVSPHLHHDILDNLHKLSFTSMSEMGGTRHHFSQAGRLVANKLIVYSILQDTGTKPDEGLHIKENLILGVNTSDPVLSSPLVNAKDRDRSVHSRSIETLDSSQDPINLTTTTRRTTRDMSIIASYESFIGRTWALVVISLAIFGICVSLWMLAYVFIKMCDGTLNGNQSMGVLLLIGVIITFASVVPWLLPPSQIICAVRHFLHPLAFCLCFGLLLLKVMQLRSLISVGLGGTIPQINQFLSLFFMVMVQVVITTEWYVINMPLSVTFTGLYPECDVARETFLLLHVYPCLLLILTFLYGMSVFRIKRNYNEGRWVTCATVCIIPVLAAWAIIYYFAPANLHDPTNAICIVIIGGVLISTIFFPKMHTISQQSKYRKLKMHSGGSDSTYLSSYYTNYNTGYNPGYHHKNMARYSRSHSKYRHPSHIHRVTSGGVNPYLSRFNGLNYLSNPYLCSNSMSYTDWTSQNQPGYYHHPSHYHEPHCSQRVRIPSSSSSHHHHHHQDRVHRKSASRTPEGTLGSSKHSSSKRDSEEVIFRGGGGHQHKKSSLKNSSSQLGLLLNHNGLISNHNNPSHYDESSRVYHITP